jgi:hypothetical protein
LIENPKRIKHLGFFHSSAINSERNCITPRRVKVLGVNDLNPFPKTSLSERNTLLESMATWLRMVYDVVLFERSQSGRRFVFLQGVF